MLEYLDRHTDGLIQIVSRYAVGDCDSVSGIDHLNGSYRGSW